MPRPTHARNTTGHKAGESRMTDHRPPRPETDQPGARPVFNDAESPLSWLRSRRGKSGAPLLSDAQFLAGERLRADFERGMLGARVTANWDISAAAGSAGGNRIAELADRTLAARERYHRAVEALGPELAGIAVAVCCMAAGLEEAERRLSLPQRSGKAVLGLALTALARHYGLLGAGQSGQKPQRWGLPDYRPGIPASEEAESA